MIPYGKQSIDQNDIDAVIEVLNSDWLTTGPKVDEFERAVAGYVGSKYAVAVSSGTAALHAAMFAIGIDTGDEVIVPPITFAATANAVVYQRGTPVFTDIDPDTLLIDPKNIEEKINSRTKAIIAVDYAGQACEYEKIKYIANKYGLILVADSCHALGAEYRGKKVGNIADLTVFSFHPVKHITTGEGGMITTDNSEWAEKIKIFRNHGITSDHHKRKKDSSWFYEIKDLGYNYRITDIQCALGISQLKKLSSFLKKRHEIAKIYDLAFEEMPGITPLHVRDDVFHAYHLYVVKCGQDKREKLFKYLRDNGIGVNVHYVPVHLHPYYQRKFCYVPGLCPVAEEAYKTILSLPIFPEMSDEDVERVVDAIRCTIGAKR